MRYQIQTLYAEVKTHINLLLQISKSVDEKFQEVSLYPKKQERGVIDGLGTVFEAITGDSEASRWVLYDLIKSR